MEQIYRRVDLRLLPVLFTCYLINYLDRVNVSFASLTMAPDLKIDPAAYGFGAGLFFIGYFFFEIPSNLLLYRFGARVWIARIIFSWGFCSMLTAFVQSKWQFFAVRFLLGAAEAGFLPGVILYLSWWYPAGRRARVTALFFAAVPVAGILGGPVSGWILDSLDGIGGLQSWQWLFLIEGLPCWFVGFWVLAGLPDRPRNANWLDRAEQASLQEAIAQEEQARSEAGAPEHAFAIFRIPAIWKLSLIYFTSAMGLYGISFWLPTIIKSLGWSDPWMIGLLTAIPWLLALIAMRIGGGRSDRTGERRIHAALAGCVAAAGFLVCGFVENRWIDLAAISMAAAGTTTYIVVLLTIPASLLNGRAAASGIAMVNSIGNLGGFISPTAIGWLAVRTGNGDAGQYMTAGFLIAGILGLIATRALQPPSAKKLLVS